MLARFRLEAKLARRVTHPNVARTFDISEHEGDNFLTTEFIDGESLASKLAREGAMSLAAVVDIAGPICAGLSAAHAAGVVHRDLKPDNVLMGKSGEIKIEHRPGREDDRRAPAAERAWTWLACARSWAGGSTGVRDACIPGRRGGHARSFGQRRRCFFLDLGWMDHCPLLAPWRTDPRFLQVRKSVAARVSDVLAVLER